jgi:hypothetical protein
MKKIINELNFKKRRILKGAIHNYFDSHSYEINTNDFRVPTREILIQEINDKIPNFNFTFNPVNVLIRYTESNLEFDLLFVNLQVECILSYKKQIYQIKFKDYEK